jgi:hypothetical protein
MINYSEIKDFEEFEELCDTLLKSEGLETRRLGRGPGQLGKDIVGGCQGSCHLSHRLGRLF